MMHLTEDQIYHLVEAIGNHETLRKKNSRWNISDHVKNVWRVIALWRCWQKPPV